MSLLIILFVAGVLTILLPCILPLLPIVLGVSIAGRSKWRPLLTVAGMVVSFVGFTFLLLIVLRQFVEVADYMRIGTYYILLLFGLGFLTHRREVLYGGTLAGSLFFIQKGWLSVAAAAVLGALAMHIGGRVAARIQQAGSDLQHKAAAGLGGDSPLTAFIIGLTMGLVWVPCAGPALSFAFTLVREQPGLQALLSLTAYGMGAAVPLLIIGYGGQAAVHSVRFFSRYSGYVKQVSGALLIFSALAFQLNWFVQAQTWFVQNTTYGTLGTRIEEAIFGDDMPQVQQEPAMPESQPADGGQLQEEAAEPALKLPLLPKISPAPELSGLGPWHNSEPFTLESLRGKVVLVDFWTYSCINCIRTLPYLRQYWEQYQDSPFVLLGVHTPEFVFEQSERNVADAIRRNELTYPIAQDNDYETWRAFSNRYWPAKYLIDAEGVIRYTHFGEGEYEETDLAIQALLAEIGVEPEVNDVEEAAGANRPRTPETYLGSRSWESLQNGPDVPTGDIVTYEAPQEIGTHMYALEGDWQLVEDERQVLRGAEGAIRMRFIGSEINLVMGMEEGAEPASVEVLVDGASVKEFTVDFADLFALWQGAYGLHDIVIQVRGSGTEAYAFTFGG